MNKSYVQDLLTERHYLNGPDNVACKCVNLEYPVNDVRTDRSPSAENSYVVCQSEHSMEPSTTAGGLTGVAHFLPKFLSVRVELALFPRSRTASSLTDIYRHVAVARWRGWGRWLKSGYSVLLVHDSHVTSREYALQPCAFIASFGPVGVHKLCDGDAIVRKDGKISIVGRMVFVES